MSRNAMPAVPALALLQSAPTEAATAFGVAFQPDREESGPGDRAQLPKTHTPVLTAPRFLWGIIYSPLCSLDGTIY